MSHYFFKVLLRMFQINVLNPDYNFLSFVKTGSVRVQTYCLILTKHYQSYFISLSEGCSPPLLPIFNETSLYRTKLYLAFNSA